MSKLDSVFEGIDNIYTCSKDLPEQSHKEIPGDLIAAIDNGSEVFFDDFKTNLPNTYEAIISACNPIQLCENIVESGAIEGYGEKLHVYYWCMNCKDRLVLINIPAVSCNHPYRKKNDIKFLSCIPEQLHCFYKKMGGMSMSTKYTDMRYDFPFEHTSWQLLQEYCEDLEIPLLGTEQIFSDFEGDDLRVLMRGSHNDLVILNFSKKDGKLYHVHNNDFNNYKLIENPAQILDNYFANALKGFPEEVALS